MAKIEKLKAIVFIDGNNLYHNLKASRITPSQINLVKLSHYACNWFKCDYVKTIYYNSIPDIRDGKDRYYSHMKYIDKVGLYPNFEVKTRKLQKNSTFEVLDDKKKKLSELSLCELCKPIIEFNCKECVGDYKIKEKGIDVMIVVDMINLTLINNKCDCAILISGDADFIPAMDLIKAGGKKPVSAALYKGYSFELRQKHGFFILDRQKILDECCD